MEADRRSVSTPRPTARVKSSVPTAAQCWLAESTAAEYGAASLTARACPQKMICVRFTLPVASVSFPDAMSWLPKSIAQFIGKNVTTRAAEKTSKHTAFAFSTEGHMLAVTSPTVLDLRNQTVGVLLTEEALVALPRLAAACNRRLSQDIGLQTTPPFAGAASSPSARTAPSSRCERSTSCSRSCSGASPGWARRRSNSSGTAPYPAAAP